MQNGLEKLNELTWSYRAARTLHVLTGLKVFTLLGREPQTADALAASCDVQRDLLEKLLIAGVAMELLKKEGDKYCNTPFSAEFLVEGKPMYQGNIIAHASIVWDVWSELPQTVGLTQPEDTETPQAHENFILGMHNITMAGRGRIFLDAIDLSGKASLLDVGGGPGTYSILACRRYPELRCTVFDLPETIAVAGRTIAEHNLTDRIAVRQGSWDSDDFGQGFDAALMSNILHGPDSQAAMKLGKAFAALQPGGMLIVQEFLLTDDKTGPLVPALFNIMVGAYSRPELIIEIERAGFTDVRLVAHCGTIGSAWLTAVKPT